MNLFIFLKSFAILVHRLTALQCFRWNRLVHKKFPPNKNKSFSFFHLHTQSTSEYLSANPQCQHCYIKQYLLEILQRIDVLVWRGDLPHDVIAHHVSCPSVFALARAYVHFTSQHSKSDRITAYRIALGKRLKLPAHRPSQKQIAAKTIAFTKL